MATYSQYNQFTIPQVNFTAGVFKPQELKFEAPEASIAQHSLDKIETRKNQALTQRNAFETTMTNLKEKIGNDAESNAWFEQWSNKYRNEIDSAMATLDFGKATELAGDIGSRVGRDAELLDREENYEQYKDFVKSINDSKASQRTKDRYLAAYQYKYSKDSKTGRWGREDVDRNLHRYTKSIQEKLNWVQAAGLAMGIAVPTTISSSTSNKTQTGNTSTDSQGDSSSYNNVQEAMNAWTNTDLSFETLKANIAAYFQSPEHLQQAYDELQDMLEAATEMREEINNTSDATIKAKMQDTYNKSFKFLYDESGVNPIDEHEYINKMTEQFAKSAQRHDRQNQTQSARVNTTGSDVSGSGAIARRRAERAEDKQDAIDLANQNNGTGEEYLFDAVTGTAVYIDKNKGTAKSFNIRSGKSLGQLRFKEKRGKK